jgi:Queuosine salvage protein
MAWRIDVSGRPGGRRRHPLPMDDLREACAAVAARARSVTVVPEAIPAYAAALADQAARVAGEAEPPPDTAAEREARAAYWLTMDAINFGSGWFPTLRKPGGRSGYFTIATALKNRFAEHGPWPAAELAEISAGDVAATLGQAPDHELMALFATSLNDLGRHVETDHGGHFAGVVDAAGSSAAALVQELSGWDSFADTSRYDGQTVPFLKRAQIAAADLSRASVAAFRDLDRLTTFADNLVPHVLRLDGLLTYEPGLLERIERGELIEHGSPEEVEIRACALHTVALIAAERRGAREADIDCLLWHRGQEPRYKAVPRHRSRCTAY